MGLHNCSTWKVSEMWQKRDSLKLPVATVYSWMSLTVSSKTKVAQTTTSYQNWLLSSKWQWTSSNCPLEDVLDSFLCQTTDPRHKVRPRTISLNSAPLPHRVPPMHTCYSGRGLKHAQCSLASVRLAQACPNNYITGLIWYEEDCSRSHTWFLKFSWALLSARSNTVLLWPCWLAKISAVRPIYGSKCTKVIRRYKSWYTVQIIL